LSEIHRKKKKKKKKKKNVVKLFRSLNELSCGGALQKKGEPRKKRGQGKCRFSAAGLVVTGGLKKKENEVDRKERQRGQLESPSHAKKNKPEGQKTPTGEKIPFSCRLND